VKTTQKSISAKNFKKLNDKKVHVTIKACNEAGCSVVATKTKSF
jgi:ferredoxin-like protein FixX